jgi:acetamidase/formamidase
LHGYFSRELAPALTIDSGDVVSFQTLDAGWGAIEQEAGFSEPRDYIPRDLARHDVGSITHQPANLEIPANPLAPAPPAAAA